MKPITTEDNFPKILTVSEEIVKESFNKHLPQPLKTNEVVKVLPFSEQTSYKETEQKFKYAKSLTDSQFKKRFVKILRKSESGDWSVFITSWKNLKPLIRKSI